MNYPEDNGISYKNLSGERVDKYGTKFTFDKREGKLDDVLMIFYDDRVEQYVCWPPDACPETGTPIGDSDTENDGEDLEYVGLAWKIRN